MTEKPNLCRIVAEIGTAHGGSRDKARRLIGAAAETGADTVKFQWVIAREILHPRAGSLDLPGGSIPLYQRFLELEQPPEFYTFLKEECERAGVGFLCSPFGLESLAGLRALGVREVKIASPELNHLPLLEEARCFDGVILSSGVSTLGDMEEAVAVTGDSTVILHCVTRYPAPEEEYNLNLLPHLAAVLGVATGVSDHSLNPVLVPALTAALGGVMVEKHFTLSKTGGGLDDPIALGPEEFTTLVQAVRRAEREGREETIRRLSAGFGEARVRAVLGSGKKVLAPSEAPYYDTTNRSIMALEDIAPGEPVSRENSALLRSETNLTPGLPPRFWPLVLGRRAQKKIPSGEGITWEAL